MAAQVKELTRERDSWKSKFQKKKQEHEKTKKELAEVQKDYQKLSGEKEILQGIADRYNRLLRMLGKDITNGNIVFEEIVGQQVMAAVTIGPDKRLYCGTIGSGNIGAVKAFDINKTLETDSWSIRGGDIQGTNRQK